MGDTRNQKAVALVGNMQAATRQHISDTSSQLQALIYAVRQSRTWGPINALVHFIQYYNWSGDTHVALLFRVLMRTIKEWEYSTPHTASEWIAYVLPRAEGLLAQLYAIVAPPRSLAGGRR